MRQPTSSPISAPAGTPATVPSEMPAKMIDVARVACSGGTSRLPSAPPMAQKPPTPMPSNARPSSTSGNECDSATIRFDTTSVPVRPQMT